MLSEDATKESANKGNFDVPFLPLFAQMGREETASTSRQPDRFQLIFRTVPVTLCIASMAVMLRNNQTNEYGPLHYANVAAFKYLVYANGICAGYGLLSAIDSALFAGLYSLSRAWVVFILDQVLAYVLLAAVAAGAEILFLSYRGDRKVSWSEVCVAYGKFCYRARASIVISGVGVACFVGLSLASAYRLFSKYDPPLANHGRGNSSSES